MKAFLKILMVLIFISVAYAKSPPTLSKEEEILQNLQSFSAHFKQVLKNEKPLVYYGVLKAKAPNWALWVYEKPLKKEIYMNDKEVVIYEPNLFQATITPLKDKTDFFTILKRLKKQDDGSFKTTINKTAYRLIFKDGKPFSLEFKDEMNNLVTITFSQTEINPKIPNEIFVFKPKDENIDIVRQ
ncbi:LolA-like outer membrane lipoprotein chaperone [Helicobacter pylori]|uniref:LolA-like outer membrane lipoprotein chaperone n=1 Tax=Helicobacter pylori TaxID=210 RepID=UPI000BE8B0CA|nr:LolA-like outer membrane lipoprotein chaperone [Helicobacter pylori]PDW33547.1 outer-membrane lipoprotein carrier protein [Helicobacter pylori]PDX20693.1 outer-membrane lipoprotein carrier protein [Helicobacter pylori]WQU67246.1 LolA-like outer membrane lipoprotein chaperone [Helicobacter pylori]